VVDTGSGGTTSPVVLTATATSPSPSVTRGASIQLDGSTSAGALNYQWSQLDGPPVTLSGAATANPTVSVPFFTKTTDTSPVAAAPAGPARIKLVVTGAGGATSEAIIALAIQTDTFAVNTGSRHRLGTEFRISGTSTVTGSAGVLTPATSVVIYDTTPGRPVSKLGTAQVDTLGAWSYTAKPGPARQVTNVLVQSTRGGTATTTVATR
jgi:hypothetical protein